jgi:hypothetical protein
LEMGLNCTARTFACVSGPAFAHLAKGWTPNTWGRVRQSLTGLPRKAIASGLTPGYNTLLFMLRRLCYTFTSLIKVAAIAFAFSAVAFGQTPQLPSTAACGKPSVNFKVKLDESPHTLAPSVPGKAQVYFFQDAGTGNTLGYPTVKVALDGEWAGANHGNSFFSVSVEPGEHHVCITLQSSVVQQRVELAHFTAEPEKNYYYRTRLILSRSVELLELTPIDSDQAKYLVASFPLSTSTIKR